jgi:hypothetical protein
VPAEVVAAAFALDADDAVGDEPIAATAQVPASDRRRHRPRATQVWWVVQRLEALGAAALPEDTVRRRVAQRMLRDRYRAAQRDAETRLRGEFSARAREAVVPAALDALHIRPIER